MGIEVNIFLHIHDRGFRFFRIVFLIYTFVFYSPEPVHTTPQRFTNKVNGSLQSSIGYGDDITNLFENPDLYSKLGKTYFVTF